MSIKPEIIDGPACIDEYTSRGRAVEIKGSRCAAYNAMGCATESRVGHVNGSMHRRVALVSFAAYHPLPSVSAQRACHRSLCQDTSLLHPCNFQASFLLTFTSGNVGPA